MADAVCKEQGRGWRKGRQRTVWWTQYIGIQDVVGGRRDSGLYDGCNVSGARMWLEVGTTEDSRWTQCIRSKGVAGGRKDRGLYDGRNVSGARMWLEVEATEDSMVDAMYKEQGCGWR